jgi:hypothetical protein
METGKPRTSLVVKLEVRAEGAPVPEVVILVPPIVPVAVELERDPVAVALELVRVAVALVRVLVAAPERSLGLAVAELELGQVAAPLVHVPVAVVLERDLVAGPLRTQSVTAAHHRGQAPPRGAEVDLAVAAAETMHVPAATEAVAAWAAADTAVAAADVVAAG